jgi:hypothetical protein
MIFGRPLEWRETHRQPRFFMFDGRIVVLVVLTIMHIRVWTVALLVGAAVILVWFDRKNIGALSILRYVRATLAGRERSARGNAARRSPVDFGFETQADVDRVTAQIEARHVAHRRTLEAHKTSRPVTGKARATP